ncbi:hypothetical protein DXG01_009622 [Tephrocybe rancida]|nr:hypothetical protein DXG01_009622 [Tephrocybe rancida]
MASAILNAPASSLELASRFSPATLYAALAVAAIAAAAIQSLSRRPPSGKIHDLGVFSFLSAWAFFAKRHDFIWATFKEVGTGMFRFRVLRHSVVALSGDTARKAFFTEPGLELRDGYALAVGAAPWLNDNVGDTNRKVESMFTKQVHHFFRTDRVGELLPVLFDDIQTHMESCGREGTINPFTEIYNLAFSMLVRLASCHELSKDKEALAQLARHYWDLEKSSTPFALMFPWFPGPGRRSIERATKNMCDLVSGFVELRRRATEPSSDAIDILIAEGATNDAIVAFTLGSLFAGLTPIGMSREYLSNIEVPSEQMSPIDIVCWNLLYLGMHPEWKAKVSAEIQAHLEQHTTVISSQPLHERLASIPISAWEHELPVLDSVVRETVRMTHGTQTLFRRNMGGDIYIDGSKIRSGEFLAYSAADVHRNPDIYSQPLSFDPARFNEDRAEDKKYPHAHVGWGSGTRILWYTFAVGANFERRFLALIFAGYEFEIVDATGKLPTELLWPDKNDILKFSYQKQSTPVGGPYFLKFRRVVD